MDTLLNFSMLPQLRKLKIDTSSAQSFKALKSFFTYVDDLEHIVNKKKLNEKEFREALDQLTWLHVSEEESDFIFRMLDANKDGLINTENELKFSKNDSNKWWYGFVQSDLISYIPTLLASQNQWNLILSQVQSFYVKINTF